MFVIVGKDAVGAREDISVVGAGTSTSANGPCSYNIRQFCRGMPVVSDRAVVRQCEAMSGGVG